MKHIKSFKLYEMIYTSLIGIKEYSLVFDPTTNSAWFKFISATDDTFEMEIKSNGIRKDKQIHEIIIFSPHKFEFDFEDLIKKFIYIANKNVLGYKFKADSIEYPRYGLSPYSIITMTPHLNEMVELERIFASTKAINNMVKKGDLYQFTF